MNSDELNHTEPTMDNSATANEFDVLVRAFLEKLKVPAEDIQKNAAALFAETVNKMDLVTRDELERQHILLAKAQAELVQMKEKISQLEQQLSNV